MTTTDLNEVEQNNSGGLAARWKGRLLSIGAVVQAAGAILAVLLAIFAGAWFLVKDDVRQLFRVEVINALAAYDDRYFDQLFEGKDAEREAYLHSENILKLINNPPAIADLQRKIDAVYVLNFSRHATNIIGADGKYQTDRDGNLVWNEIKDSVHWVYASEGQHVCLSIGWEETTPQLIGLLKNRQARAYVRIGEETRNVSHSGLKNLDITPYIERQVRQSQQSLFSIELVVDVETSATGRTARAVVPDYKYNASAVVTAYKGKIDGVCSI